MAKIMTVYEGNLRCRTQNQNGDPIITDVEKSHGGQGVAYSPVDMVLVSLTSCILSVMAIVAKKHGMDIKGAKISGDYEMADKPVRRIGKIRLHLSLPEQIPLDKRPMLERTIKMCPVYYSLSLDIQHEVKVDYTVL